jgi:hypothetical protein
MVRRRMLVEAHGHGTPIVHGLMRILSDEQGE